MSSPAQPVRPVTDRLLLHAQRAPERIALVSDGEAHSYGSLLARARATAGPIGALTPPGSRIGVLAGSPVQVATAFLGASLAGSSAVLYDPRWTSRQQQHALDEVPVGVIVADRAGRRRLSDCTGAPAVLPGERPGDADAGHPAAAPHPSRSEELFVGFTSGSSGAPKAYSRSSSSWIASFAAATEVFGLSAADRFSIPGPLHHSLFLFGTLCSLWLGATAGLLERFSPGSFAASLNRLAIDRVWCVPTMLAAAQEWLDRLPEGTRDGMHGIYCSGSAWSPAGRAACRRTFPGAEVVEFYGASELSFVAFESSRQPAPGLRPFPGVQVEVRDRSGKPLGAGQIGRIFIRSPMLFSRYLSPEPQGFERDGAGWVSVGDLGRLSAGGVLAVTGRSDAMLNCGGENLHPEPIEQALEALGEVAEAAIVGVPDARWGHKPIALVRFRSPDRTLGGPVLRAHCRRELGSCVRPHEFWQVDALPRTGNGKLSRAALGRAVQDGNLPMRRIV